MSNINLQALIEQMTIEEKADQLFQLAGSYFFASKAEVTGPLDHLGVKEEDMKRIGTVLGLRGAEACIKLQSEHLKNDRNKIPMVFMRDIIHGCRTVIRYRWLWERHLILSLWKNALIWRQRKHPQADARLLLLL